MRCCMTTITVYGIPENDLAKYVDVYPNPAINHLSIRTNHQIQISEIALYDMLGQMLYNTKAVTSENGACHINLANFASGVYMLKVVTTENEVIMKRIIKN